MRRVRSTHALTRSALIATAGLLAACLMASQAVAQQVYWQPPGPLAVGQRSGLELVFEETEPDGPVTLPRIDGLSVLGEPSHGTNISTVNGRSTIGHRFYYPVRADREGKIDIPSFQVRARNGVQTVAGITLRAQVAAPGGHGKTSTGQGAVVAKMAPTHTHPYVGEVFDVEMSVELADARRGEIVGPPAWDSRGIVAEPWSKPEPIRNGAGVRSSTRAMASEPGTLELPPVRQEVRLESGRAQFDPFDSFRSDTFDSVFNRDSFFADFFSRSTMTSTTVTSNASTLTVQPLPQPAPSGFTGAVGTFELESKIVPENPKAGDPVTWTLTVRGTGNWPSVSLPARAIPNEFRTLQPKQHREFAENAVFTGAVSEDLVLVPSAAGEYRLDPVRFVYFDTQTKQYQTAMVTPPTLTVTGTAAAVNPGVPAALPSASTTQVAAQPRANDAPGDEISTANRLPRDPMTASGSSAAPMNASRLALLIGAPFFCLAAYWMILALRRARLNDPERQRRHALRRLAAAIEHADRATDAAERRRALRAWQDAAGIVLSLEVAAPTPCHVSAGELSPEPARRRGSEWVELWAESDHALYGPDATLAQSWTQRAKALCAGIRLRRHNPLRALQPQNLIPRAAMAGLVTLLLSAVAHATPVDDYAAGNFAAAREQFHAEVQADPSNWTARYNLGLAEAQLGARGRALGETAAGFLHQPRHEAVRWNLGVFAAGLENIDRVLSAFAHNDPHLAVARIASPAQWQMILVASACGLSLGGALALRRRHHATTARWHRPISLLLLIGGIGVGLAAVVSLHQYGRLAAPGAGLIAEQTVLRSVPTDAQSEQAQRVVAAGTVVVTDKDFLGWTRVTLENGETGWLRNGDLVAFYGPSDREA